MTDYARYAVVTSRGKIWTYNHGMFVEVDLLVPIVITEAMVAAEFLNHTFDRKNCAVIVDLNHPANKPDIKYNE